MAEPKIVKAPAQKKLIAAIDFYDVSLARQIKAGEEIVGFDAARSKRAIESKIAIEVTEVVPNEVK